MEPLLGDELAAVLLSGEAVLGVGAWRQGDDGRRGAQVAVEILGLDLGESFGLGADAESAGALAVGVEDGTHAESVAADEDLSGFGVEQNEAENSVQTGVEEIK